MLMSTAFISAVLSIALVQAKARGGRAAGGFGLRSRRSSSGASSSSPARTISRPASRANSAYVKVFPGLRYGRVYSAYRSRYTAYYGMYFAWAQSHPMRSRSSYSQDAYVCVNYEATGNGSYMGVFRCPLEFEPPEFTQCCGVKYAEYCCEKHDKLNNFLVGVGIIALSGVFLCFCTVLYKKCKFYYEQKKLIIVRPATSERTREQTIIRVTEQNSCVTSRREISSARNQLQPPNCVPSTSRENLSSITSSEVIALPKYSAKTEPPDYTEEEFVEEKIATIADTIPINYHHVVEDEPPSSPPPAYEEICRPR